MSTSSNELERGTNWAAEFAFHTGRHVLNPEDLKNRYVAEKAWEVKSDTEALLRFLDTFLETGDLAHLADYRGRLEVMAQEVDSGAWHAIVSPLVEQKELDEDEEEEEPTERDWLINAATFNPMDEMYDDYA